MEKQPKDTVGLQPTEPNTLYQEPTNHARRMPMEQNKREQFIIRRIGGTTYKVRVVFNESGGETMEDKILRIVRNDMVTSDGTYGIINTEEAGTLVFSGVPAFFVTIVLLVQCSVKQKFIVVQPMKTSL